MSDFKDDHSRTFNEDQLEGLNGSRQRQMSGFRTQYITNFNEDSANSQIFLNADDLGGLNRKTTSLS